MNPFGGPPRVSVRLTNCLSLPELSSLELGTLCTPRSLSPPNPSHGSVLFAYHMPYHRSHLLPGWQMCQGTGPCFQMQRNSVSGIGWHTKTIVVGGVGERCSERHREVPWQLPLASVGSVGPGELFSHAVVAPKAKP